MSQMEWKHISGAAIETVKKDFQIEKDEADSKLNYLTYHLLTAFLLLSVGSLIEYSKNSDKSILMICIFMGFLKVVMALFTLKVIDIIPADQDVKGSDLLRTVSDFLLNM